MTRLPRAILALAVMAGACTPVATPSVSRSPAPASPAATSGFDQLRSRGVVVAIRMEAPQSGRQPGDPAHGQKRAFESAVATLLLKRVLGTDVRIEVRNTGGDRLSSLTSGQTDVALAAVASSTRTGMLLSAPYARAAIVLAAPASANVKSLDDLRGKTIAIAQDELGAKEIVEAALKQRGIEATLLAFTGVRGAVDAVEGGTAAALVGDGIGLDVLRRDRPSTPAVVTELVPLSYILGIRSSLPDLHAAIDRALRDPAALAEIAGAASKAGFPYRAP